MRVREKRKPKKELKDKNIAESPAPNEKAKLKREQETESKTPPPTAPSKPVLPAAEKVAFDNRIKHKNVLALNEKVAALREYDRQPIYKHVGRMFNCSPDQIKRIVQQRDEIQRAWEQRTRRSQDARTLEMKVVRVSMLGRAVYDWIRRMMYYKDFLITDGLIQKMALQFKSSMGLYHFFPHQEWCDKFRQTYNIEGNDTKELTIGYKEGYSVQIKDIVKDVMSECTPEAPANTVVDDDEDNEQGLSTGGSISNSTRQASSDAGDDDADVDVDGGGSSEQEDEEDVKPALEELEKPRVLPQLVRLPLPSNTPPGTSQKVLLATPIPSKGSAGAQPMTMTIIPLATLAQSITQRPLVDQPALATQEPPKTPMVPTPMLDVKQEIKVEPKDADDEPAAGTESAVPAAVHIKQELESDSEQENEMLDDDANGGRSSVTSLAEVLAGNMESEYIEQSRVMRSIALASPETESALDSSAEEQLQAKLATLPPLPALTKGPNAKRLLKRSHHDDNNNNGAAGQTQPTAVISCAEARKYLKLLEQFALHKENFRLIALITRADEVIREIGTDGP